MWCRSHSLNVCHSSTSKFEYLQVQLIVQKDYDINKVLWERENTGKRDYLRLATGYVILMNAMLWTQEVIENNTINFFIFDNEMYQRDNCIKSDIWSDVILLVSITLFCDQGRKSESLEERKKIM